MEDHIVAIFDLLGFSDVIKGKDEAAKEKILALLKELVTWNQETQTKRDHDAATKTTTTTTYLATTAFSDHIVFSLPSSKWDDIASRFFLALDFATRAGRMAEEAMAIGCLVRGAISLGPMYHEGGVLFGEALVEAHELESKFARYPRVILSDRAAEWFAKGVSQELSNGYFPRSPDNFISLNYLRAACDEAAKGKTDYDLVKRLWFKQMHTIVDAQIDALRKNLAGLSNWHWFKNQLKALEQDHEERWGPTRQR
jgi:hypothetical protein